MPYIKQKDRDKFNHMFLNGINLDTLDAVGSRCDNPGDLNYAITTIVHTYLNNKGKNYQHYNDILGALEGVKFELYRRSVAPYEDLKIIENGDVK